MACIEKLKVINSQTGLRPFMAAPTAKPAKPISVIGVSMTRLSPYFFHKPRVTWNFFKVLIPKVSLNYFLQHFMKNNNE